MWISITRRALLFRPGFSALRLCLLHRDLSASPEELEDRLAARLGCEQSFHLRFPRFVSFSTFAHPAFCWARHRVQLHILRGG